MVLGFGRIWLRLGSKFGLDLEAGGFTGPHPGKELKKGLNTMPWNTF